MGYEIIGRLLKNNNKSAFERNWYHYSISGIVIKGVNGGTLYVNKETLDRIANQMCIISGYAPQVISQHEEYFNGLGSKSTNVEIDKVTKTTFEREEEVTGIPTKYHFTTLSDKRVFAIAQSLLHIKM